MIPPVPVQKAPPGERLLFQRLLTDPGTSGWTVLHSLNLAHHVRQVEGEADFVVIVPELGVLCVEVKSHLSVRRAADGMWHLGKQPPTARSPFRQASDQMHSIRKFLSSKRFDVREVPFWSAVWFTGASAEVEADPLEWQPWQLLDRRDLRRPVSQTLAAVLVKARQHLASRNPAFDPSLARPAPPQCDEIARRLRPRFETTIAAADYRQVREQDLQHFLDEQYEALDAMDEEHQVLFTGPAGTGKTFLALEAAKRASLQGLEVRFACYNRLLGQWLASELQGFPGIRAGSLHSLMVDLAGERPPRNAESSWWNSQLPDLALEALLEREDPADVLIVDEIQDLCDPAFLDVLDLMVRGGLAGGRWLMFGDFEHQAIYGTGDGRAELAGRSPSLYRRTLARNCRNTPRIGRTAAEASGLAGAYRGFRRPDDGIDVTFMRCSTPAEQERSLARALDLLNEDHFQDDEIVVLSPMAGGTAARAQDQPLRNRLADYATRGKKVRYCTVHAFKGLDAPAVVVTDIDTASGERAESLLYIALSRATDRLVVLANDEALKSMWKNVTGGNRL
ncbi:nuclease-related domain-containing DEAD/DEAH box helicase [Actinomadura opuntiae]|uniref:nuclease-related domain-containing DEAD/DEAH box helicase n=1 Tax=Actinomadura sp. OS1-43 TaxID=604315 RepID=UPI00255A7EA7|nr:NERD domain-containing protein [Actinomadura sp. OS1-43]MDL4816938.1 NERD domain-containing protein [Actinomadura sp. OS1-43]